jgi:hypothetical protein
MKQKTMTAEEMEHLFDDGDERYLEYFDLSTATRPGLEAQKVNVSLPNWMVNSLDSEADRIGVTRQAIIKLWLDEKLKAISATQI